MSEQEIVFGTSEHIAGLSRKALEEDFRWVQKRCTELEVELQKRCTELEVERERMAFENANLRDERDRMYKANVEKNGEILRLLEENAKLRELVQDYDAMLAIAAKNEAATSIILPLDAVLNALRIRAGLLGIGVDK